MMVPFKTIKYSKASARNANKVSAVTPFFNKVLHQSHTLHDYHKGKKKKKNTDHLLNTCPVVKKDDCIPHQFAEYGLNPVGPVQCLLACFFVVTKCGNKSHTVLRYTCPTQTALYASTFQVLHAVPLI